MTNRLQEVLPGNTFNKMHDLILLKWYYLKHYDAQLFQEIWYL